MSDTVSMKTPLLRTLVVCASLALAGCGHLLPRGSTEKVSRFETFEAAKLALDQVEPYRTTLGELAGLGFDPAASANVTVVPYPEVITRLAPHPGVPLEALDRGVRDCILAQTRCRAFEFRFGQQTRRREGGFWADFFNVRRTTLVTGWRFEGLVVVRDGLVLFRNAGGEPRTDHVEQQLNPLGPFQSGGESAGQLILR